jgi:hypothetical protein
MRARGGIFELKGALNGRPDLAGRMEFGVAARVPLPHRSDELALGGFGKARHFAALREVRP